MKLKCIFIILFAFILFTFYSCSSNSILNKNSNPIVILSIEKNLINEDSNNLTITATLEQIQSEDLHIILSTSGSATENLDYIFTSNIINITKGNITGSTVVTILDDNLFEGNESLILGISSINDFNNLNNKNLTLTIIDNEDAPLSSQTFFNTISHQGRNREYILYIPNTYNKNTPTPLVFNFHGYTGTATEHMENGDLRPSADLAAYILVYPQGEQNLLGDNAWNSVGTGGSNPNINDLDFIEKLIDYLSSKYNIDESRIYSTGFSMGGAFSYLLASQSERFAAIAPVAGYMTIANLNNVKFIQKVPVLEIHGISDNSVYYNGGSWSSVDSNTYISVDSALNYWITRNNCNKTPINTLRPDLASGVTHTVYTANTTGIRVEHFAISNFYHARPFWAYGSSSEIWKFFSKYNIDGLIQE